MKLASEDLQFMHSLGRSLLALLASALILIVFLLAYHFAPVRQESNTAASLSITGRQFETLQGVTRLQGDALVLESLDAEGALLSHQIGLRTQDYPIVRYRIEGLHPGLTLQFLWQTDDGSMHAANLPRSAGTFSVYLASQDGWRGTVSDIALLVKGDTRDQRLIIQEISFEPHSWQGVIAAVFSEWTEFRGWTGASINIVFGTPDAPRSETLSPTLAMAAWGGLALILLYGMSMVQGRKSFISYCAVVLIPWIALDQLWQSQLSTQLQETRLAFGGKTTHQKHLADQDSVTYSYVKRLKESVLPASGARIIVLHNSSGHDYIRLKTQYYLLPHNIWNFGVLPPTQDIHSFDYILVLGDVPELRYLSAEELLVWEPNSRIKAKLVDTDSMGQLYRVMPSDSGTTDSAERTRQD